MNYDSDNTDLMHVYGRIWWQKYIIWLRSLDEKYEKWSGSRALSAAGNDALAMLDANREKFRLRHKLLEIQDLKEVQPSEIVKSMMAKRSVFDEDLKRLESVGEKYEPKDFGVFW